LENECNPLPTLEGKVCLANLPAHPSSLRKGQCIASRVDSLRHSA
jgi:hypothetical protein